MSSHPHSILCNAFVRRLVAGTARLAPVLALVCGLAWSAPSAHADIVILRDGKVLPNRLQDRVNSNETPSDQLLESSGKGNLELRYDTVKVGKESVSASLVVEPYSTIAYKNPFYVNAEIAAGRRDWVGAAEGFGRAADELTGAAKQIALHKRVLCYKFDGNVDQCFDAIQALFTATPNTYYFAEMETLRARLFMIKGKKKDAKAALERIVNAKGMNARDYFDAKITLIDFFMMAGAGNNKAAYAKAEQAYRDVLSEIRTRRGADTEAATQRLRANVGVAKCLVRQGKPSEAQDIFKSVIADKNSTGQIELLASAYLGLGDTQYATVQAKLKGGNVGNDKVPGVVKELHEAAKNYLRVARFYGSDAGDELTPSMLNCARVWATIFTLEGEQDLDLGIEAQRMFLEAHRRMPRGEERRVLTTEIKEFMAKVDVLEERAKTASATGKDKPK